MRQYYVYLTPSLTAVLIEAEKINRLDNGDLVFLVETTAVAMFASGAWSHFIRKTGA